MVYLRTCQIGAAVLLGWLVAAAAADPLDLAPTCAGTFTVDVGGGAAQPRSGATVYDNLSASAAPNFAIASTDADAMWGDRLTLAQPGTLGEVSLTLYNGASVGDVTSATIQVVFRRSVSLDFLGVFTADVQFPTPLAAGSFARIDVVGLAGLATPIDLPETEIFLSQQVLSYTGTSTALGVVSHRPILVGDSIPQMFIDADTVGNGVPGFYQVTSEGQPVASDPGYRLVLTPEPSAIVLLLIGVLGVVRRR